MGLAAPLLAQIGSRLLEAGRTAELEARLDAAPPRVLESVPELLLRAGEALQRAATPRRAVRWLRLAAVGFAARGDASGLYRSFCRLALAHGALGEYSEMQAALRQVEHEMETARGQDRAEGLRALGEYHLLLGQAEGAAAHFREAAALLAAAGQFEGAGAALTELGAGALVALGRLDEALEALREAQGLAGGDVRCEAALAECQILLQQSRWAEAEAVVCTAAPGSARLQARTRWARLQLRLAQGDAGAAEQAQLEIEREPEPEQPDQSGWAAILAGWLALATGDTIRALASGRRAAQVSGRGNPLLAFASRYLLAAAGRTAGPGGRSGEMRPDHRLRVECFGAFRLYVGEREVPLGHWGRAQVRGLLQALLLQPGFAASREGLLESFWPDEPAASARARLRVGLNRLRQGLLQLGFTLESSGEIIRLPREQIGFMDLLAFREHLAAARAALAAAPEAALASCRAGRALYRGRLLEDAFWPGVEDHRQQAEREAIALLGIWAEAARRTGRPEEALVALDELALLDPGDEETVRQAMRLLLGMGRRGEALRRYRSLERWLQDELGVAPAPETQALLREAMQMRE